jgi:regulator of sirC expression with transglutaminase-like and TPR domain
MAKTFLTPERQKSLLRLLDDETPLVRNAVCEELQQYGKDSVAFLKSLANDQKNPELAKHAKLILNQIHTSDSVEEFIQFIHSFNYELETGFILLDRTKYSDLEHSTICNFLDQTAQRVKELMIPPMSARNQCLVINRVLFHELGFRGNAEDYYNPENAFLSKVIENRKGLPIILSVIYILVAYRCNFYLEPIALPGHFMVGCFDDALPFFIDPFDKGSFKTVEDICNITQMPLDEKLLFQLTPAPVGEVLCRNCRNLVNQFHQSNQPEETAQYIQFVKEFEKAYKKKA